jgi:hypothetical protein
MRIPQQRTPAGCAFLLAAGWLAMSLIMKKDLMLDYIFVAIVVLCGIFLIVYRKIYPDSILVTDAVPQPGELFRGNIETPLKTEPTAEMTLRLDLTRRLRRNSRKIWQAERVAHPIRGEHGIILPVEFSIPAELQKEDIDQNYSWNLSATANVLPIPYRAAFVVADSARNRVASA